MKLELTKEFTFEASHILPRHPGKCSRLHGHSWMLRVSVEGPVDRMTGFVMDYSELKKAVQPTIDALDHHHLGTFDEIPSAYKWCAPGLPKEFYPSSENLIVWIGRTLSPHVIWSKLELNETCTSACILTRNEYNAL